MGFSSEIMRRQAEALHAAKAAQKKAELAVRIAMRATVVLEQADRWATPARLRALQDLAAGRPTSEAMTRKLERYDLTRDAALTELGEAVAAALASS